MKSPKIGRRGVGWGIGLDTHCHSTCHAEVGNNLSTIWRATVFVAIFRPPTRLVGKFR